MSTLLPDPATSSGATRSSRDGARKLTPLAVAFTLLLGMGLLPWAHADNDRHQKRGRSEHREQRHDWRDSGWRRSNDAYGYHPGRAYRRDYYERPVYVPPPVYYAPQQSPGISLFFPLDLR